MTIVLLKERPEEPGNVNQSKIDNKTYSSRTRMVFYCIINKVPTANVPSVITQVLKRAGLDVDSVPQRNAIEFMTRELGAIAELQTAEVGLGTDGAASMVGKDKGAVKIIVDRQVLQEGACDNQCRAVGQHCSAHKLNLAASQAGRGFLRIERLKTRWFSNH